LDKLQVEEEIVPLRIAITNIESRISYFERINEIDDSSFKKQLAELRVELDNELENERDENNIKVIQHKMATLGKAQISNIYMGATAIPLETERKALYSEQQKIDSKQKRLDLIKSEKLKWEGLLIFCWVFGFGLAAVFLKEFFVLKKKFNSVEDRI